MVTDDKEIVHGQLSIETNDKEQQLKIDRWIQMHVQLETYRLHLPITLCSKLQ